jgi:protein TonB
MKYIHLLAFMFFMNQITVAQEIKDEPDKGIDENAIYNTAGIEIKPEYPGGMTEFYNFIGRNFRVPNVKGLAGKIIVTFVIEKDGSITDIKVIRDIGYGTSKEAVRVLQLCENWIPGEQQGKKVRVLYSLPIVIQTK